MSKLTLLLALVISLSGITPSEAAKRPKKKAAATKKAEKRQPAEEITFGDAPVENEAAVLDAVQGQGLGACYVKLHTENLCITGTTERKCLEMAREKSPAICYFNEGELECTPQSTQGLGQPCQGTCARDTGEVNNFTFNIIPPGCPQDVEFKDTMYCAVNEMRAAEPNADLGLCGSPKTLGIAYDGVCKRELPDKKAVICGKGRP